MSLIENARLLFHSNSSDDIRGVSKEIAELIGERYIHECSIVRIDNKIAALREKLKKLHDQGE